MAYLLFLTMEVGEPMVSNHSVSYLFPYVLSFLFISSFYGLVVGFFNLDMEIPNQNYPCGGTGYGLASLL